MVIPHTSVVEVQVSVGNSNPSPYPLKDPVKPREHCIPV